MLTSNRERLLLTYMINLNEMSPNEVQSLARLKQLGSDTVMKVLDKFIQEGKDALVSADDMVRIHRLQGRIEAYKTLVEAVNEAAKLDARTNRV